MEETGKIIKSSENEALVKITRHSLCSKCSNKCQLALDNGHESDEIEVSVSNPIGAKEGQLVKIEMGEQSLVIASLIVYMVPLLSLILGYFIGSYSMELISLKPGQGAGIIGALLFLGLSLLLVKTIDRYLSKNKNYHPTIKEIVNEQFSL